MIKKFKSNSSGLWPRFISKLFGSAILLLLGLTWATLLFGISIRNDLFFVLFFVVLFLLNFRAFKDNPLKWQNIVTVDLKEKTIRIENNKSYADKTVLDAQGVTYNCDEIESYSIKHYESFIFNSYYLVKIIVNGKALQLISFNDAQKFTDLVSLLKNQLKLPIK